MEHNPYDLFKQECPELAARFDDLVAAQRSLPGLEPKTRQLINIAIQSANRTRKGVYFHARMARDAGASWQEIVAAVAMNLRLSGLGPVLECLPSALEALGEPS
ncbi:MAG TPA: carboxymuconolactone decarboxylase family protein [bacterium]|nr:carboxymuconolactone decarboxylase family protein [bacterium]